MPPLIFVMAGGAILRPVPQPENLSRIFSNVNEVCDFLPVFRRVSGTVFTRTPAMGFGYLY